MIISDDVILILTSQCLLLLPGVKSLRGRGNHLRKSFVLITWMRTCNLKGLEESWKKWLNITTCRQRNGPPVFAPVVPLTSISKPQYEKFFREWNFRKNLPKGVWVAIARALQKRERDGLNSEVYIFDKLVSERKIRKEISRYKSDIESANLYESMLNDADRERSCLHIRPRNAFSPSLCPHRNTNGDKHDEPCAYFQ